VVQTTKRRTLLLGWRGGVGRAVLALLRGHPLGRALAAGRELVLLDAEDGDEPALTAGTLVLPARHVGSADELGAVLDQHAIDEVVELALVDTFACIEACARRGVDWLTTSLERWPADVGTGRGALDDALRLVPGHRPATTAGSHLVGSGMNPGCVNALFDRALHELAARTGVAADPRALAVYAVFVSESDTTTALDDDARAFAMTWRPQSCLHELFVPAALVVEDGRIRALPHRPVAARYRVACGDEEIEAHLVPHDELVTLGLRHAGPLFAYAYALPPAARRFLATQAIDADPDCFAVRKLWPPHTRGLAGRDRVGVLVCSRRFGELWCGFDTDVDQGLRFGTNATLLQVAAGVLAGWDQLGARAGVHVVEELDTDRYLQRVCEVLGPIRVVHRPDAPFTPLPDRRC